MLQMNEKFVFTSLQYPWPSYGWSKHPSRHSFCWIPAAGLSWSVNIASCLDVNISTSVLLLNRQQRYSDIRKNNKLNQKLLYFKYLYLNKVSTFL